MDSLTRQRTRGSAHIALTMAALTAGGGVAGFVRTRSIISAASGLVLGGVFALSGYMIHEHDLPVGYHVATGASLATGGAMGWRFFKTRKVVPAGLLAPVALASAAYHGYKGYTMEKRLWDEALEEMKR